MVAFLRTGGVRWGKLITWLSCCSLMQCIADDGSPITFEIWFFASPLFPWTVAKVMRITVCWGWSVGAQTATACPVLLMEIDRAGTCAPAPWTPKPMAGSVDLLLDELVCCRVVHQRSAALMVESPVDVAVTRVCVRDPSNPWRAMPI